MLAKDVFCLVICMGQRKILSPHVESNLTPLESMLRYSATEPQRLYGEQGSLQSPHTTYILHTVRISNVNSVIFYKNKSERW